MPYRIEQDYAAFDTDELVIGGRAVHVIDRSGQRREGGPWYFILSHDGYFLNTDGEWESGRFGPDISELNRTRAWRSLEEAEAFARSLAEPQEPPLKANGIHVPLW